MTSKRIVVFGHNRKGGLSTFLDDNGQVLESLEPRLLPLDQEIKAVGCGKGHTVWVTRDNEVYVAGDNAHGQLGKVPEPAEDDGDEKAATSAPEELNHVLLHDLDIEHAACGDQHTVLTSGSKVILLGEGATLTGSTPASPTAASRQGLATAAPLRMLSMPRAVLDVACGGGHTLARLADGSVMAWGRNRHGQLGLGDFVDRVEPCAVRLPAAALDAGLAFAAHISCGRAHSAILLDTGNASIGADADLRSAGPVWPSLLMCGASAHGQLGRPAGRDQFLDPVLAFEEGLPLTIHSVACGAHHTFVQTLCAVPRSAIADDGSDKQAHIANADRKKKKKKKKKNVKAQAPVPKTSLKKRVFVFGRNQDGELGLGASAAQTVHRPCHLPALDSADVRVILGDATSFVWIVASKGAKGSDETAANNSKAKHSSGSAILKPGLYACGRNTAGELGIPKDTARMRELTEVPQLAMTDYGRTFASSFTIILSGTDEPEPKTAFRKDVFAELQRRQEEAFRNEVAAANEEVDSEEEEDDEDQEVERKEDQAKADENEPISPKPKSQKRVKKTESSAFASQVRAASPSPSSKSPVRQASPMHRFRSPGSPTPAVLDPDHLEQHAVLALEMERLFADQLMCDAVVKAGRPSTLVDGVVPSEALARAHLRGSTDGSVEATSTTGQQRGGPGTTTITTTTTTTGPINRAPAAAAKSTASRTRSGRLFPVHSAILECRCSRIAQLIQQEVARLRATNGEVHKATYAAGSGWDWRERMVRVELGSVSEAAMPTFLQFLYSDREALIERFDADNMGILLDLAYAAHSYGLDRLLGLCQMRIATVLTTATAVPVLGQASNLGLLAIKRLCLEFIRDHYELTVSRRNRVAVEALNSNPALLAEVVGLTSADFAASLIDALPEPTVPYASVLVHDLGRLKDMASFADVEILPSAGLAPGPSLRHEHSRAVAGGHPSGVSHAPVYCHAIILAARCPALFSAVRSHIFCDDASRQRDANRDPMKSPFPLTEEHFAPRPPPETQQPKSRPHAIVDACAQGVEMIANVLGTTVQAAVRPAAAGAPETAEREAQRTAASRPQASRVDQTLVSFVQEMGTAQDSLPQPRVESISEETQRMQIREVTEASPKAIRVFLDYLYAASTKSVSPEIAIDILMMCHVYQFQDSALHRAAVHVLKLGIDPSNVLDVLCVSTLVHDEALQDFALSYAIRHPRECLLHGGDKLRDAIADFPDLGVALVRSLAQVHPQST